MEEGIPMQVALSDVIRAQGYEKVAKKTHMARPNIMRAVRTTANPTVATMQKLLRSVGLDFSVRPWPAKQKLAKA